MNPARASRISEIDLLRFVAAMSVVFYHKTPPGSMFRPIAQFGFLGVHLFFLISGFVILWTASKKDTYEFLASRISRLYPSFWICVLLTYAALTSIGTRVTLRNLLANMLMYPSLLHEPNLDSVYWTLQLELKFYAFFAVMLLTRQIARVELWLWAWLFSCAVAWFVPALNVLSLMGFGPLFIAGSFLYLIQRDGRTPKRMLALVLCLVEGERTTVLGVFGFLQINDLYTKVMAGAILASAFLALFLIATRRLRLPGSPIWYWLGGMTYPLYLIHYEAVGALTKWLPRNWYLAASIAIALPIAAVLAAASERRLCPKFDRILLRARDAFRQRGKPAEVVLASRADVPQNLP